LLSYAVLFIGNIFPIRKYHAYTNGSDDPQPADSQLNPNAEPSVDDGQGGDDTSAIAGLWDGSILQGDTSDVVYWLLAADGVLTRYDYQQDGALTSSGENCYIVGNPITVSAEDGDTYSFFNVAATAVVNDETLTITFIEADKNDLDNNGNTTEIPNWPLLSTPQVEDLNACVTEEPDQTANADESGASGSSDTRPLLTRAQCRAEGGTVIGDIGNGAIHRPEYRCESGQPPIARITYLDGEPIATEGEVCCL